MLCRYFRLNFYSHFSFSNYAINYSKRTITLLYSSRAQGIRFVNVELHYLP